MEAIISSYQCEWKTTVENPEKLKRFSHFVNSEQSDGNVMFVKEREQNRPASVSERKLQLVEV